MESKKPSRRKFLKGGAEAAVAGLAVGAIGSANAQTIAPDAHPQKPLKDLVAYGERSRFVTSVRVPVAERESPDQFGLTFHVLSSASGFGRGSSRPPRSTLWALTAAPLFRTSIPSNIAS